jgi:hypothetical protein
MGVTTEEKTVTVEKRSGSSETNATVTDNGKSGSAKGGTAEEALGRANNGGLVHSGFSEWPVISLALGLAGSSAIVVIGMLLAQARRLDGLRYCGEHSIVIYLAFFLPMAATRTLLLKFGLIHDIGIVSLLVTIAGIFGALAIWWMARGTRANFLFERLAAFWIAPRKVRAGLQATRLT